VYDNQNYFIRLIGLMDGMTGWKINSMDGMTGWKINRMDDWMDDQMDRWMTRWTINWMDVKFHQRTLMMSCISFPVAFSAL